MKTLIHKLFFLYALLAGLGLTLPNRMAAQTFTPLYDFTAAQSETNDGAYPGAGLILSDGVFYGTTEEGGANGDGTIFAFNLNSLVHTNLHSFNSASDGSTPYAGLILSGNTLYGTASYGGNSGNGTIFAIQTSGLGFTNLYHFTATVGANATNSDGANPIGGLILSGNTLYGTASAGGASGYGTVFALNLNNLIFSTLHSFTNGGDGANPQAGLILSGGILYGTAENGGSSSAGTVFAINTSGSGLTNLHSFGPLAYNSATEKLTNSDGANPQAGLILSGSTLYGTCESGGIAGEGTVFAVNTGGSGFANLHNFTAVSNPFGHGANSDGSTPLAALLFTNNMLYGTAYGGGASGYGAVFALNTNGSGFMNLYSFTATFGPYNQNTDGANPMGGLIFSGNNLYGTASEGGNGGDGTIFSIFAAPPLSLTVSGTKVILTWPASATGFTLQSVTNLTSTNWTTVSPSPANVNGQNTVTNQVTGAQMFYRLAQ